MARAFRVRVAARTFALASALPALALAQGLPDDPRVGCPDGAVACARAAIHFDHREAIPIEFSFDTGWQPPGSDLQIRFYTALQGHTEVSADGTLLGAWPTAMQVQADPTAGSGQLAMDYGVWFETKIRFHIATPAGTYDWEGHVPGIPYVDFGAMGTTTFDPWAWEPVQVEGTTSRQLIAMIPLTSSIIPIPGISGGLSFEAQADLTTQYHSTEISFGSDADPITSSMSVVQAMFSDGASVLYNPQLQGEVDYSGHLDIYPGLYIDILGYHREIDPIAIPIPFGPFASQWQFDPSPATLDLPDVGEHQIMVDFGNVAVGDTATQVAQIDSNGNVPLWIAAPSSASPFTFPTPELTLHAHTRGGLPIQFTPTTPGAVEAHATLRTDDPDTPLVTIVMLANGFEPIVDAGTVHDAGGADGGLLAGDRSGGCGCRAAGSSDGTRSTEAWVSLGALATVFARRRRRITARDRA